MTSTHHPAAPAPSEFVGVEGHCVLRLEDISAVIIRPDATDALIVFRDGLRLRLDRAAALSLIAGIANQST